MLMVTTMSYDQLATLIRDRSITLNNDNLIFGQSTEVVGSYLRDRFGSSGYVVGIRGRINEKSAALLSQLDKGLGGNKLILEAPVQEEDMVAFSVKGLEEAAELIAHGIPTEMVYDQLDSSISTDETGVQIICVPEISRTNNIRITSINREISVDADGITFVKLKGGK